MRRPWFLIGKASKTEKYIFRFTNLHRYLWGQWNDSNAIQQGVVNVHHSDSLASWLSDLNMSCIYRRLIFHWHTSVLVLSSQVWNSVHCEAPVKCEISILLLQFHRTWKVCIQMWEYPNACIVNRMATKSKSYTKLWKSQPMFFFNFFRIDIPSQNSV